MALPSPCGRITDQQILHALGWQPGHGLDIQPHQRMLVIGMAENGRYRVGSRGALPLPSSARRMCGIEPGEPVLLAALIAQGLLVVHPVSTVARLVADLHTQLAGGGRVR
ncbi:AbrB/MazE/SpoVT family DNA-binding domain-containing protein [Micromonospora aurantiaca]|uniref:AbrB/MazE/SpoVT family DNA-binding domain-containing protein n=2 Tax=Micromonospora aurantiaca (nom. illeg.) TaxID=47850 RepID=A0ABQ6U6K4_9ACTN|nr:AbrB/MazE/SpoVT family DNA-binding domain-containing protein [Micromonospora aurantiaca]KAB1099035.1 AbrB/MazE/SpoVT family DNA-binding domain-containing protein [Micromonospora aurantiaca]